MIKRALFFFLGMLAVVVAAELVLRALPVSTATNTGYRIAPNILNYPPHHEWTMATGWDLCNVQHLRSNNMGFAAEHGFVAGSDAVGLIGDRYVEASMLPLADRPAAQLERALDGRQVYAMGEAGSSLLDYAERIEWANRTPGLKTFVVLMETTDASQTVCDSGNVHARCLLPGTLQPTVRRLPKSGLLKNVLRESALAHYLNSQLKRNASRLMSKNFWQTGTPPESVRPSVVAAGTELVPVCLERRRIIDMSVNEFFEQFTVWNDVHVVFVIDINRSNLQTGVNRPDERATISRTLGTARLSSRAGRAPLSRAPARVATASGGGSV